MNGNSVETIIASSDAKLQHMPQVMKRWQSMADHIAAMVEIQTSVHAIHASVLKANVEKPLAMK